MSVITVTHGRRGLLLRKAASLDAQTLARSQFEWRIVVNGDVDGTEPALRTWAAAHPSVRMSIVVQPDNLPIGEARNRAMAGAGGYILYLSDDDCLLATDTLERHLACQEREPGAWLGRIVFRADDADEPWAPGPNWWQLNGANASVPADLVARAGGFDASLRGYGGEDLLLGYRLHRDGVPFAVCPDAKVVHVGPNPVRGADLEKARQAGANAARIVVRHPELATRLGVHPAILLAKGMLYGAPWSAALARAVGGRFAYEHAYWRGVTTHREGEGT